MRECSSIGNWDGGLWTKEPTKSIWVALVPFFRGAKEIQVYVMMISSNWVKDDSYIRRLALSEIASLIGVVSWMHKTCGCCGRQSLASSQHWRLTIVCDRCTCAVLLPGTPWCSALWTGLLLRLVFVLLQYGWPSQRRAQLLTHLHYYNSTIELRTSNLVELLLDFVDLAL